MKYNGFKCVKDQVRSYRNILKEKAPLIWSIFKKLKDQSMILFRLKDVFMMMILFHIWPKQTYKFSTRGLLPSEKYRHSKNKKTIPPYQIIKPKTKISKMKEINVIGVSPNFDLNELKKMNGPIFLVTFWTPLQINDVGKVIYRHPTILDDNYMNNFLDVFWKNGKEYWYKNNKTINEFKKREVTYVLSRKECLEPLKNNSYNICGIAVFTKDKNGNYLARNKLYNDSNFFDFYDNDYSNYISVYENIYKSPEPKGLFAPTGSFLPAICALSQVAEKVNVYGWDFYLDRSPKKMNYWQLFFNMYKFAPDMMRSRFFFESALINFYYGYQLSKLPNINIHGYMGHLQGHSKLMKRIEKVLFN
jgi:hypothetical protein